MPRCPLVWLIALTTEVTWLANENAQWLLLFDLQVESVTWETRSSWSLWDWTLSASLAPVNQVWGVSSVRWMVTCFCRLCLKLIFDRPPSSTLFCQQVSYFLTHVSIGFCWVCNVLLCAAKPAHRTAWHCTAPARACRAFNEFRPSMCPRLASAILCQLSLRTVWPTDFRSVGSRFILSPSVFVQSCTIATRSFMNGRGLCRGNHMVECGGKLLDLCLAVWFLSWVVFTALTAQASRGQHVSPGE